MSRPASASLKCLLASLAALLVASASPAPAQTITYTPTTHSAYQAVDDLGNNVWTFPNRYADEPAERIKPISLTGVVINNPWDMLNYTYDSVLNPKPKWQVYIQATPEATALGDFGGTALYMMKNSFVTQIPLYPDNVYTPAEWQAEMGRLNNPGGTTMPLQRGDLIRVDANAPGLFYNGKCNINEGHLKDPAFDFNITILQRGLTPVASAIALDALKDSNDTFLFDKTRTTGCEHYQGSLVHLDNLVLDSGTWGLNSTVTVRQGNLTFPMLVGLDPALASITASDLSAPFSVTAILDQESTDATTGYRLWLTNAADLTLGVPEPGTLVLMLVGGVLGILAIRRKNACSAG